MSRKASRFTVLYVGQFRPFKGIDILINAARIVRDVDFILVGDSYMKLKLMHIAEGLKNVKFVGEVSDEELKQLYERAHVICLPSINTTEAYGLVLIEGAIYGCIPLASDLIGVRENLTRLKGLSFELGSCVSLVKKIMMLSNDKGLWIELAKRSQEAAYNYVKVYTLEHYVNRHEDVFKSCL